MVKASIPIGIEQPRKLAPKREQHFHGLEDRVWMLIEDEVKKTPQLTRDKKVPIRTQ